MSFVGEFSYTMDAQRRIPFPKVWLESLGDRYYLLLSRYNFIRIISEDFFVKFMNNLNSHYSIEYQLAFLRLSKLFQLVKIDNLSKITIPQVFKDISSLSSSIVISGDFNMGVIRSSTLGIIEHKEYALEMFYC